MHLLDTSNGSHNARLWIADCQLGINLRCRYAVTGFVRNHSDGILAAPFDMGHRRGLVSIHCNSGVLSDIFSQRCVITTNPDFCLATF
jgi:hypothetical protein